MSLVPDYGDSSDSDITSEEGDEHSIEQIVSEPKQKLPTPGFIGNVEEKPDLSASASVFANPFIQAEIAKDAVLEKHVKMIATKANTATINGKKICWNYRKGRCRFGHNCKYAHDSDVQKTNEQVDAESEIQQTVFCQNIPQPTESCVDEEVEKKRKKRPGLTPGLVPSKKVMKDYTSHKLKKKFTS